MAVRQVKIAVCGWWVMVLAMTLMASCAHERVTTAADDLTAAEAVHAASPDSVKAYEDLLRTAIRKAEDGGDWLTCARAALLLSAQLQWTDEREALALATKAQQALQHDNGTAATSLASRVRLTLAGLHEQTGDTARARSLYQSCLDDEASRNLALGRLANLCLADGDAEGALALASQMKADMRDSVDIEPLFILANCYLQCDSLEAAQAIYEHLSLHPDSKTRYAALRHLAEIAILDRRLDVLPEVLDSAFASAETVFFEALQQKDAYFRATLEQERRAERLVYRGRLLNWALVGVTIVGALVILFIVSLSRHRRAIQWQRLQTEQRERELVEERLQHEAREREREAREAEERLLQQGQKIQLMQRFILDKSEVLQRLRAEGDQQRRLSDREWLDLEEMLDSVTGGFVTRLRSRYPSLRDGDVRLCMLTRMGISNQVISDIYLITTSAVKHRKLKLKKDGFGVSDPECSLDEVIANI